MTNLTLTHLRFDAVAQSPVNLQGYLAGNNLRNALANVIRYATCPETHRRGAPTAEHAATCPACWLLAAEVDPGKVVRAYAVVPPLPARTMVEPGEGFSFGLTLFGEGFHFLPYFVLAVAEAGRVGVGPGRGNFAVAEIWAAEPLQGWRQQVLAAGESLVRVPELAVGWAAVPGLSQGLLDRLNDRDNELAVRFLTPLRLEEKGRLFKVPDFSVFFRRLLFRIDSLGSQFAGEPGRDRDEVAYLHHLADQVRLVESETRWHELWSWSGRKERKTPLSGLVGMATYWAEDWGPLLPWLVWGQATQVGKSAVKGNGVYELQVLGTPGYWGWLEEATA